MITRGCRTILLLLAVLPPLTAGCTVNPATGQRSFTGLLSEDQELRLGRDEHPKVLAEFGGAYEDAALQRYVGSIGQLLARTSERPELPFTFTIINSPIVNAFALPGGYIYITRGLMALAGSEAELAGVLGHEIGHVTARHAAERYSQGVLGQGLAVALGILTGSGELAQAAQIGAMAVLQGYSRDQEFQADLLGVRYLSRAGYDPAAMASFLAKMQAESALQAQIEGRPGTTDETDIMSTHPRTLDRVERAIAEAGGVQPSDPMVERELYLQKIDGMLYGDDPKEGLVRGRRFVHPILRFEFEVPPGFSLYNGTAKVTALGPENAAIIFDLAPKGIRRDLIDYVSQDWGRNLDLRDLEEIEVNGLEGATGQARVQLQQQGTADMRLVAIRYDSDSVYRFIFLTPAALTDRLAADLRRTTYSFRRLSEGESAGIRPQRLRILTAAGESVATLARRMDFDEYREERFRVLNGLAPNEEVRPGERVKIVTQ